MDKFSTISLSCGYDLKMVEIIKLLDEMGIKNYFKNFVCTNFN
jgi:hypothetical protein